MFRLRPRYTYRAADYALLSEPGQGSTDTLFVDGDRTLVDHSFVDRLGEMHLGY